MSTYKFGDKTEGIRILQQALADNGFNPGVVDSVYGPATLNAINDARAAYKLEGINRVDEALLREFGILPQPQINPLKDWLIGLAIKQVASHLKGLPQMDFLSGFKTYILAALILLSSAAETFVPGLDIPGYSMGLGEAVMVALALVTGRGGAKADVNKALGK